MSRRTVVRAAAAAVIAQATLAGLLGGERVAFDLPLVVVVLAALARGPASGIWTGTAAGLAQDLLSGGIVGVGGLSKSVVGFVVGVVGARFLVTRAWQQCVVVAAATVAHAACFFGVYALLPAAAAGGGSGIAGHVMMNTLAGAAAIGLIEHAPRWARAGGRRRAVRIGRA